MTFKDKTWALLAFVAVSLLFVWPLPLHLGDALLGTPGGDLGVYVWNLWVFRHEVVEHQNFPLFTSEILALTPAAPLTLQNYTIFANLISLPLQPFLGIVRTFNVMTIGASVLNAYAMFLYARRRTGDTVAAWIGGMLFGFAPFMAARQTVDLSLVLAAPLPIFGLVLLKMSEAPTPQRAACAGGVVGWAYLCDPYYAVYCLMMLAFTAAYSTMSVQFSPPVSRRAWWLTLLDLAIVCVAGLVTALALTGGGRLKIGAVSVSLTKLYTPVFVLVVLILCRLLVAYRPTIRFRLSRMSALPLMITGCVVLTVCLAPVLYAMSQPGASPLGTAVPVFWRSSAPGLDLLAFFVPNPMHPWLSGLSARWLAAQPNGFEENVAALPWSALIAIAGAAVATRWRPPHAWVVFTSVFVLFALGPFVRVAGLMSYVPTPWTLIRYLPVFGAARMPTRLAVLVLMAVSMLLASAVSHLRADGRHRTAVAVLVIALLFEVLPLPRPLYSAEVPAIFKLVKADPRPVRLLHLPFGLRDGLGTRGDLSAGYQYFQTFHEKPMLGGYLSRLPRGEVARYEQIPAMKALLDLSEGRGLTTAETRAAVEDARARRDALDIGWVAVDASQASPAAVRFAEEAFELRLVATDGNWQLYQPAPGPEQPLRD